MAEFSINDGAKVLNVFKNKSVFCFSSRTDFCVHKEEPCDTVGKCHCVFHFLVHICTCFFVSVSIGIDQEDILCSDDGVRRKESDENSTGHSIFLLLFGER